MNKRLPGEAIFVLLLIVGLLAFVLGSLGYTVELRAMPQAFGLAGVALLVLVLIGIYFPSVRQWTDASLAADWTKMPGEEEKQEERPNRQERPAEFLRIIAYMVAVWVAVLLLGLTVTIPVFLTVFLVWEAKLRLRNALIASAVTIVIIVLALKAMGITLWAGIIPEIIPGYLGGSIMPLL
jgi:hypothetical protein